MVSGDTGSNPRRSDAYERVDNGHYVEWPVEKKLNPTAAVLRPGQSVKVQKANVGQVITSWRAVTAMPVAVRYNSMNRDKNYARKLSHAYDLISQRPEGIMRPLIHLTLCLCTLAPSAMAVAADGMQTEQVLYETCSSDSQAGMKDCLAGKAEKSVKTLAAAQKAAAEALSKWDEDQKYIDQAKARLAASNQTFASYRSAQCEFSASLSGGAAGNAHEMGKLACQAALNQRRARQLRDAVLGLPLK